MEIVSVYFHTIWKLSEIVRESTGKFGNVHTVEFGKCIVMEDISKLCIFNFPPVHDCSAYCVYVIILPHYHKNVDSLVKFH